jgi:dephospho-CoA kinase
MMDKKNGCLIGVTGGIGSGKSRTCRYLASICRAPVIDLDLICRDLLVVGAPGWRLLKKMIGPWFFLASGELDRTAVREAIFADDKLRSEIDGLLHPLARAEMFRQAEAVEGPVLVEIPLLFEAGWQDDVDVIIVVYADKAERVKRIVRRDLVSAQQAEQAVAAQQSLSAKALLAHHVIANSGDWSATCEQLQRLAEQLHCS